MAPTDFNFGTYFASQTGPQPSELIRYGNTMHEVTNELQKGAACTYTPQQIDALGDLVNTNRHTFAIAERHIAELRLPRDHPLTGLSPQLWRLCTRSRDRRPMGRARLTPLSEHEAVARMYAAELRIIYGSMDTGAVDKNTGAIINMLARVQAELETEDRSIRDNPVLMDLIRKIDQRVADTSAMPPTSENQSAERQ